MSATELPDGFHRFGDIRNFALDIRLYDDPDGDDGAPATSVGSWGAWRLWIAGNNLCRLTLSEGVNCIELDEVRWYLAPFFRWILKNREPLLHETRFPSEVSSRATSGRSAYLSVLQWSGDTGAFAAWQDWAHRHAARTCAEGGILPDVFFQRIGDEIEFSWGDRVAPGAEAAAFVIEPGVARTSVASMAQTLNDALNFFLHYQSLSCMPWFAELKRMNSDRSRVEVETRLSWYLDSSPTPGPLYNILRHETPDIQQRQIVLKDLYCLPKLSPQVAMFGALSPDISASAAAKLIGTLIAAETNMSETAVMQSMFEDIPAWVMESPWDDGYQLAREVLEEAESNPALLRTDLDDLIMKLGIDVKRIGLGEKGPRGVAIAGPEYTPTIVTNIDNISNSQNTGTRFTIAHELCHILFDRDKAKSIFHASTPWAHPSVEQRANAFAAMLLMPPYRIDGTDMDAASSSLEESFTVLIELADTLDVGKVALVRHLSNLGKINEEMRDELLLRLQG